MTIIAAARSGNEVSIGCDSLTSFGNTISTSLQCGGSKIVKVEDIFIGSFGTPAILHHIQEYFGNKEGLDWGSNLGIFKAFEQFYQYLVEGRNLNVQTDDGEEFGAWEFSFLIVARGRIFSVHELREVFEHPFGWAIGSGEEYCRGAMHALKDYGDISADRLVRIGLEAACEFDAYCGGEITTFKSSASQI